jgi:N-acetylneuraminic acid mutarotase
MFRLGRIIALVSALVAVTAFTVASNPSTAWRKLPRAPFAVPEDVASTWTGRQLIVYGRRTVTARDERGNPYILKSVDAAETYDPTTNTWTRLSPPRGPHYVPGYRAVWTGKQMLVFGAFHSVAFTPATKTWHELPKSVEGGILVWTGREAIGWGGGCCGDASSTGTAYNPARGTYRNLPRSPLAASQTPIGAWTGRELILFVSGYDPDGKSYPASLARGAAYNPVTNTWRRIAPLPAVALRAGGTAVWDGHELLVVGAGKSARFAYAYNPSTNRWRRLARLPSGRFGASVVWTGTRLLLWGGQTGRFPNLLDSRDGLAYDPKSDRWSTIPRWPLQARGGSALAWTGRTLIVWGGARAVCNPGGITGCHTEYFADGAAITP